MTTGPYKYYAFISYSRKDGRVARWLQRRLEWFRFPVKLVPEEQRPGHPKYVRPVYLDKTSLEVTREHYWESIHQAINASRFLIVLCSPAAAASEPGLVNTACRAYRVPNQGGGRPRGQRRLDKPSRITTVITP